MVSKRRTNSIELEIQADMPAASPSAIVLQARDLDGDAGLADVGGVEQQLEAADGGAAAWTILCAAFMFEAVLFGEHPIGVHPISDAMLTYCVKLRLLGFIRRFPKLLYKAPRIQGKSVYPCCRDDGVWHTLSWRSRDGCLRTALSTLSPIHCLDWLAAVYHGTCSRFICK